MAGRGKWLMNLKLSRNADLDFVAGDLDFVAPGFAFVAPGLDCVAPRL